MIDNLQELNNVVNAVANRALDIVAERSTSGQRYIDHSDVADLISREDFTKYADFIVNELNTRPEILEPVSLDDGQLDINLGLNYCKAYEWCEGDEEIFGCSYEAWLEKETEPVSHPLSLTRMAEIGHSAVAHILESSDMAIEDLTECVGMSVAEVNEITGSGMEDEFEHENPCNTITFLVESPALEENQLFSDFESAIDAYKKVPFGNPKSMAFTAFDDQGTPSGGLLLETKRVYDRICSISEQALENPHIALAHAKAVLSFYPFDEKAWNLRESAEKKLGIYDREVDISKDLYVSNWRVHVVPTGGRFGLYNHLVNGGKPVVQFYDMNHVDPKYSPNGQFTGGEYSLDTLIGKSGWLRASYPSPLCLNTECPEWTVSAKDMKEIIAYLHSFQQELTAKPSLNERIGNAQAKTNSSPEQDHSHKTPQR